MRGSPRLRISKRQKKQIYDKFGGRCAYCGIGLTYENMTVDHYIPVESYGSIVGEGLNPHNMCNLLPSCAPCNRAKGPMMPGGFKVVLFNWVSIFGRSDETYHGAPKVELVQEAEAEIQFYFEKLGAPTCGFLKGFGNLLEVKWIQKQLNYLDVL